MKKRVTIILDDEMIQKLRKRQSQLIKKSSKNVSFSSVVIETLRKDFK